MRLKRNREGNLLAIPLRLHGRAGFRVLGEPLWSVQKLGVLFKLNRANASSEVAMIRLRARVRCERGAAEQSRNSHDPAGAIKSAQIPIPHCIEIEQGCQGGYLLIHIFEGETPFVHTWHATVEDAKEEAKADLSVQEEDWIEQFVETP